MSQTSTAIPTRPSERILALDALRGFAILGILVMNIQLFAMIEAAYLNPASYGDLTGINRWVWILSHVFTDQKFMTIFSLLFGAGIVLFTNRLEEKGLNPVRLHYRRTLWLLVIGLLHAYLLWYGDILVPYALCSFIVVLFRKKSPTLLTVLGVTVFSVSSILYLLFGLFLSYMPPEVYEGTKLSWQPVLEVVNHEIATYQSGWLEQMPLRAMTALKFQTFIFLILFLWRAGGLMLMGMALFKWDVFTAQRSRRFYATIMVIGLAVGMPIVSYGVVRNFAAGWSFDYSMFLGTQFNYWGSLLVSLGYIGLIMLVSKAPKLTSITRLFGAVGRMALTNYLLQTIICTTIFYGHGFGLFGQVERNGQILIVLGVWAFQLIASPLWLRYFRFGPAEWAWRSLTYWKPQPFRVTG
ncbi:MAG: DUF418 domain-containing protein [Anaerolineae bacterium]|nr:DUF418 domain-containing protein [Anaerolineae bacterium]